MARAGDLVVMFGDDLARTWDLIVNFKPRPADAELPLFRDELVGSLEADSRGPGSLARDVLSGAAETS